MLLLRTCLFNRKQVGVDVTGPLDSRVRCRQASPPPGPIRTTCVDFPMDYVRIACRDLEGRGCTSSTVLTHYQDDFDGSTLKWLPIISTILPTTNINGIISRELFTGGPMISAGVARRLRFEHRFSNLLPLQQKLGCTHTKLDSRTSTSAGCFELAYCVQKVFGLRNIPMIPQSTIRLLLLSPPERCGTSSCLVWIGR